MKKFLCYDTNDAASGKINVDNRGMLKPNSTVPSTNGASYQQLVTDGSGTAKWEDRLAYAEQSIEKVTYDSYEETDFNSISEGVYEGDFPVNISNTGCPDGTKLKISLDGTEYITNVVVLTDESHTVHVTGNFHFINPDAPDTGEPFYAVMMLADEVTAPEQSMCRLITTLSGDKHTVKIFLAGEIVHPLDIKYIPDEAIFSGSYSDLTDKPPEVSLASVSKSGTVKVAFEGKGSPGRNLPVGSYNNVLYLGGLVYRGEGTNSLVLGVNMGNTANVASGSASLATGISTTASGLNSLSANDNTVAKGENSAAFGHSTYAGGKNQFVIGHMNIKDDENKYAFIVGNSDKNILSDKYRSNAHTIDWSGNAWFAGTVEGTAIIVKSSTPDSTKKFKITVDDSGAITATEVTS